MPARIEIARIDPFDDEAVDAWWDVYAAARRADRGERAVLWSREEIRRELQQESGVTDRRAYLARQAGAVVGAASLALPLKDNTHRAEVAVYVGPADRRRGIGSALLAAVEGEARAAARRTLTGATQWSADGPRDGAGHPGPEFARTHGYDIALGDLESTLALPVAARTLDTLLAGAPRDDYALRSWIGPVPEDVVAGWAELDSTLDTEAPTGDLDVERAAPDVAGIRENEDLIAAQGRTSFGAVALAPDGAVAAYTQLVVSGDDGNAYQWGTLVRRADRGHRLGLRLKVENLRRLQQHMPEVPRVITFNAESNAPMLAVNEVLGFVPTGRLAELQKRLDPDPPGAGPDRRAEGMMDA